MCINVQVNGFGYFAMLYVSASNSVMSAKETSRLGLQLSVSTCSLWVANKEIIQVLGIANLTLRMQSQQGRMCIVIVPQLNFDLIVRNDFFVEAKAVVKLSTGRILIMDEMNLCFVKMAWERLLNEGKEDYEVIYMGSIKPS